MHFGFTDEQKLLEESVGRLLGNEYPFETRRALAGSETGWSRELWARFGELGWLGLGTPEDLGGYGGGAVETAIVAEGLGRVLALEPYLWTVIIGAPLLARGRETHRALLPELVAGNLQLAFAHAEPGARYDLEQVVTRARRLEGGRYRLVGHKLVVHNASSADRILISARTSGADRDREGITLFAIERERPGLEMRAYRTMDGLRAADIRLDALEAGPEDVIGEVDAGFPLVREAVDRGIVGVSAEGVGVMGHMHGATLEYLRGREQFGQPLARFQALQHRMVDMYVGYELARSMVYMAAARLDEGAPEPLLRRAISATKTQLGQAGTFLGQQAIQLHGGMGMTDEMPISHYFKRLTLIDSQFGDADHHLQVVADTEPAPTA